MACPCAELFQLTSVLEVLHAAIGIVPSSPLMALMQWYVADISVLEPAALATPATPFKSQADLTWPQMGKTLVSHILSSSPSCPLPACLCLCLGARCLANKVSKSVPCIQKGGATDALLPPPHVRRAGRSNVLFLVLNATTLVGVGGPHEHEPLCLGCLPQAFGFII